MIVLGTSDDAPDESVRAFRRGCDDYVRRPFDQEELSERIRAVARRGRRPVPRVLRAGTLAIDTGARLVTVRGVPARLSQKEYELVTHLAADPGRVFTRAELLRAIWNWPAGDAHADARLARLTASPQAPPARSRDALRRQRVGRRLPARRRLPDRVGEGGPRSP